MGEAEAGESEAGWGPGDSAGLLVGGAQGAFPVVPGAARSSRPCCPRSLARVLSLTVCRGWVLVFGQKNRNF